MKKNYKIVIGACLAVYVLFFSSVGYCVEYQYGGRRYSRPTVYRGGGRNVYAPQSSAVVALPAGHRRVVVGGTPYYYNQGMYYQYGPSGYVAVSAPLGAVVPALPPGYSTVHVGGRPYYNSGGVYYSYGPNGYVVVNAPYGGVVTTLPVGYRSVYVGGEQRYYSNGVYYRPTYQRGRRVYTIVR